MLSIADIIIEWWLAGDLTLDGSLLNNDHIVQRLLGDLLTRVQRAVLEAIGGLDAI